MFNYQKVAEQGRWSYSNCRECISFVHLVCHEEDGCPLLADGCTYSTQGQTETNHKCANDYSISAILLVRVWYLNSPDRLVLPWASVVRVWWVNLDACVVSVYMWCIASRAILQVSPCSIVVWCRGDDSNQYSLVCRPSITANMVESRVKLLCRMTSGGHLEAWHFQWTPVHGTINHASRRPPDVIIRRSFTRPSTALAVIEGLGTRLHSIQVSCVPTSSSVYDPHTRTGDGTTHQHGPAAAPARPLPLTSEACHCCPVQKLWPLHPCKK